MPEAPESPDRSPDRSPTPIRSPKTPNRHLKSRDRTAIKIHRDYGASRKKISALLGIPYTTVCRALYEPTTPSRIRISPRSRKKPILPTPHRHLLRAEARTKQFKYTPYIDILAYHGILCSKGRARASMEMEGWRRGIEQSKCDTSPGIRQKRLEWCRLRQNWTIDQWNNIVFTDESYFGLGANRQWVNKPIGLPLDPECTRNKERGVKRQMVWGAIHASGNRVLFHWNDPEIRMMTGQRYTDFVIPKITAFRIQLANLGYPIIIQEDNAPPHRAGVSEEAHRNQGNTILDWPAHSPDLNPIENVWGRIKTKLGKDRPESEELISAAVQQLWEGLSPEYFKTLIASMPSRIQDVINSGGYPTKY